MIELFINKLPADLPADFSFSMEYENEFFTKASEYSLDVELPLLGSANNQKIFGNIHRVTAQKVNVDFEAIAYVNGRCVAHGYALILSVTEKSVRLQLVGNTSYINSFCAENYIDELFLGYAQTPLVDKINYTTFHSHFNLSSPEFYKVFGSVDDTDAVLFWAFNKDPKEHGASYPSGPIINHYYPNQPFPSFDDDMNSSMIIVDLYKYSFQPYLLKVIGKVMNTLGFTIRRNDINHSWLRNLYIVNYKSTNYRDWNNTLNGSGGGSLGWPLNSALPHWSVSTFIDEVEKLCACIFVFNTYNNTVDIIQLDKYYDETATVYDVPDECILDEYEFEFSDNESDKDLATGNISFAKDYTDKYLKISQEVLDTIETHNHYASMEELQTAYDSLGVSDRQKVLFIDDSTGREYICYVNEDSTNRMVEVNVWGDLIRPDSSGAVDLKIVPANTREFGLGWWFQGTDSAPKAELNLHIPFTSSEQTASEYSNAQDIIDNSYSVDKDDDSSDCMEVMLSTGEWFQLATYEGDIYSYPAPFADFNMPGSGKGKFPKMSLSLKDVCEQSLGHMYRNIPSYRSDQKFVFRFLAKSVPDARQPYRFHNQLYVCRKLNADFANAAKDLIFEGEFYRLG